MPRGRALAVSFLLAAGLASGVWFSLKRQPKHHAAIVQRESSPLDVLNKEERAIYELVERSVVSPVELWLNPIPNPLPGEKVDSAKRLLSEFEARAAAQNVAATDLRAQLATIARKLRSQPIRVVEIDALAALAAFDFAALHEPAEGSAGAWRVWLAIGKARLAGWKLPEATAAYERALALWPMDASAECKRHVGILHVRTLAMQGLFSEGENVLRQQGPQTGDKPWSDADAGWWKNELANIYTAQGKLIEAESEMRRALELAEKVHGLVHTNVAAISVNLAAVLTMRGNYGEALRHIVRAEAIGEKVLHPADFRNAQWAMQHASILMGLNRFSEAVDLLERAILHSQKHLGVEHVLTIQLRKLQADCARRAGALGTAARMEKEATADLEDLLGEKDPERVALLREKALRLGESGDFSGAERMLRHALDILPAGGFSNERGMLVAALGENLLAQRRIADAASLIEKAVAETEPRGESAPEFLALLRVFARIRQAEGKPALARLLLERVLAVSEKNSGPDSRAVLDALGAIAAFQHDEGQMVESEATRRRILSIMERVMGQRQPGYIEAKFAIAVCLAEQGRPRDALPLMQEVLTVAAEILPANAPIFIYYYSMTAGAHQSLQQHAEAKPIAQRALALAISHHGENHPNTATVAATLASSLSALGEIEEAEKLLRNAVKIASDTSGKLHSQLPGILTTLANTLTTKGALEEADKIYRTALSLYESELPGNNTGYFNTLVAQGNLLVFRGKHDEAATLLRRALLLRTRTLKADAALPAEITLCREIYTRALRGQGLSEKEVEARIQEAGARVK